MLPVRRPRSSLVAAGFALTLAFLTPCSARAQLAVEEISIVAGSTDEGGGPFWFFFIEVIGQDLTGGSVTPPVGDPLALVDASGLGLGFELEYEDGPFASFSDLHMAHPSGSYTLNLGGEIVTLGWNPTEPLGASGQPSVSIVDPPDGAVGVSSTPSLGFSFDCTNCKDLNLEIVDLQTSGEAGSLGFGQLDVAGGNFLNPIPYASMQSGEGPPRPLPDGLAEAELLLALVSFSEESFDLPSSLAPFAYIEATALLAQSVFTVPEPPRDPAVMAALGAVLLLGARERLRRRLW